MQYLVSVIDDGAGLATPEQDAGYNWRTRKSPEEIPGGGVGSGQRCS